MIYHHLATILPDYPTVFEIGAHIGTDTARLYRMTRPCYYVAFEPDERNLERLKALQDEGLDFKLYPYAISDRVGRVTFWQSYGHAPGKKRIHTDSSSIKRPIRPGRPWIQFRKVSVEAITLDWFCNRHNVNHVDFIWMDVQAAELEIIRGGRRILSHTDYIYTEYRNNRPQIYEGQPGLPEILAILPGQWEIVDRTNVDVLLKKVEK